MYTKDEKISVAPIPSMDAVQVTYEKAGIFFTELIPVAVDDYDGRDWFASVSVADIYRQTELKVLFRVVIYADGERVGAAFVNYPGGVYRS